jgi:hypothetical protein
MSPYLVTQSPNLVTLEEVQKLIEGTVKESLDAPTCKKFPFELMR